MAATADENVTLAEPDYLTYLFYRPNEPLVLPKGKENVQFDLPLDYQKDQRAPPISTFSNFPNTPIISSTYSSTTNIGSFPRANVVSINWTPASKFPDISGLQALKQNDSFSLFIPYHMDLATKLIDILMEFKTKDEFGSFCVYCRDKINSYLLIYAMSFVTLHKAEFHSVALPNAVEIFPNDFMPSETIQKARAEAKAYPSHQRVKIEIPSNFTASNLDIEHRVAYFREDIGTNLHHWYWHLVYPKQAPKTGFVHKDRRGELFYYMHEQILARYNFERFSNHLKRVERLSNFQEKIPQGYYPKLQNANSSRDHAGRADYTKLKNIHIDDLYLRYDVADLERWRDRILEAVQTRYVTTADGKRLELDEIKGIDILGNMVEASELSVNKSRYGDLHNLGHDAISRCHDPDFRHLEKPGVMGNVATAMRDPIFYRWHSMIDSIFQEHKKLLPPYTVSQLGFDGIKITDVTIQATDSTVPVNEFKTFLEKSDYELTNGLDFAESGPITATVTHLQHAPFTYKISVNNTTGKATKGTVRIFLAPHLDERAMSFHFENQRTFFIELDRFTVDLTPDENEIKRDSESSSVTVPYEQTFPSAKKTESGSKSTLRPCGCGWPLHLLIPKGMPEGMPCDLFVMISDYSGDKVDGAKTDGLNTYCGTKDSKYPDKRAMGYPFDRKSRQIIGKSGKLEDVTRLADFCTPNMFALLTKIKFHPTEVHDHSK